MSKDIMTQAKNKVTIVGKLLDVTFNTGKTKDGKPYERATATIRTTHEYNGQTETSEIPVNAFATQYTNRGTPNPAYESLQKLKDYNTVQGSGFEEADVIRITAGTIKENSFVSRTGQLVTGYRLDSSFFSVGKAKDTATFNVDIFIMDMKEEFDRDDNPTGRLIVKGGIVQYGGVLDVVEFIVEAPNHVDYISRNWSVNDTVNAQGHIRFTSQEEKRSATTSSWGEEMPETSTRLVRELIITSGSDDPFDEDLAYDPSEIKKAFNVRKARLEQLQINAKSKATSTTTSTSTSTKKYEWE